MKKKPILYLLFHCSFLFFFYSCNQKGIDKKATIHTYDSLIVHIIKKDPHYYIFYPTTDSTKPCLTFHGTGYYDSCEVPDSNYLTNIVFKNSNLIIVRHFCSPAVFIKDSFTINSKKDTLFINEENCESQEMSMNGKVMNVFNIKNMPNIPSIIIFNTLWGNTYIAKVDTSKSYMELKEVKSPKKK